MTNTYSSPNKAIQQNVIELNKKSIPRKCKRTNQKNLATKNVTNYNDVSDDITNVSSDNVTMKPLNQKEDTKEQLVGGKTGSHI